ncbi:hypothetical protein TNCV_2742271 [Trichonephila clavipes]|nr:hypothetical protein TNCV_2742271 [Trichonephila clavipes]
MGIHLSVAPLKPSQRPLGVIFATSPCNRSVFHERNMPTKFQVCRSVRDYALSLVRLDVWKERDEYQTCSKSNYLLINQINNTNSLKFKKRMSEYELYKWNNNEMHDFGLETGRPGFDARCHQIPSEYTRSTCSLNQWVRSLVG